MANKYIDIKSKKGGCLEISNRRNGIWVGIDDPECEEMPYISFDKEEIEILIKTLIELKEKL